MHTKKPQKKCSELEKENSELKKSNEDKDLRIEHLTELVLKRNKMLFGQKREKGKYICDGQLSFEGYLQRSRGAVRPVPAGAYRGKGHKDI